MTRIDLKIDLTRVDLEEIQGRGGKGEGVGREGTSVPSQKNNSTDIV